MAEIHAVIKDFPKSVHIAIGTKGDMRQINGDYALVDVDFCVLLHRLDYLFASLLTRGALRIVIKSMLLPYIHPE